MVSGERVRAMKEMAIHVRKEPEAFRDGKWTYRTTMHEVRVMARTEGYAMVRFKGCMPFVVSEKTLRPLGKNGDHNG